MALLQDPLQIQCPSPIFILCGVRPILMTLSYRGMGARDVVQILMNHFQ